jgi:hypothetical protein
MPSVLGPFVIVSGTLIAWRWLGRGDDPEATAGYVALTEVIGDGMKLSERMRAVTAPEATEPEHTAWRVRTQDWNGEAERVLGDVAPARLPAFRTDLLFSDTSPVDAPQWIAGDLLDLELRIERLRQIRSSQ